MAKAAWLTRFGQDGQGTDQTYPRDRCQSLIVRKVFDKRHGTILNLIALREEIATFTQDQTDHTDRVITGSNWQPHRCFGDVDGHSNWGILCNNNLGHSRSALRCGLLQKPL